jgi:hypothetical protein
MLKKCYIEEVPQAEIVEIAEPPGECRNLEGVLEAGVKIVAAAD